MTARNIVNIIQSQETSDGAGVRLKRSLGTPLLEYLDPFLMLDEFGSEEGADYIGGFPDHPHRGFETVTLMLDGLMRHKDNKGNAGLLKSGSVQWMTAGRGIVHSEMPEQTEGLMRGFQLWVNLPAKDKMTEPRYQNIEPEDIPELTIEEGVTVRVVAGEVNGVEGAVNKIAAKPIYLVISLEPDCEFSHKIPENHNGFVYPYEGNFTVEGTFVYKSSLGVLGQGTEITIKSGDQGTKLILVAGSPFNEPVARHGPFVMNTREEIMQAFDDYKNGKF